MFFPQESAFTSPVFIARDGNNSKPVFRPNDMKKLENVTSTTTIATTIYTINTRTIIYSTILSRINMLETIRCETFLFI